MLSSEKGLFYLLNIAGMQLQKMNIEQKHKKIKKEETEKKKKSWKTSKLKWLTETQGKRNNETNGSPRRKDKGRGQKDKKMFCC